MLRLASGGGERMRLALGDLYCRQATEADLPEIAAIYALCVRNGDAAFDDRVDTAELASRYQSLLVRRLPFVVAAAPGRLLGFAHTEPYHSGSGFNQCVQGAGWVRAAHRRRGVGTGLLRALLLTCRQARYRQVVSWVLRENEGGLALARRLGFIVIGWHREACFTGGRLHDVLLLRHDLWRHGAPPTGLDDGEAAMPDGVGSMVTHG